MAVNREDIPVGGGLSTDGLPPQGGGEGGPQGGEKGGAPEGEPPQAPSRRSAMVERLRRGRHAGREFKDDDELYEAIGSDYDDYDSRLSGYRENERKFSDLLDKSPMAGHILSQMAKGRSFVEIMTEAFGPDILEDVESEESQKRIADAVESYTKRMAESRRLDDEFERNLRESVSRMETEGFSDDEIDRYTGVVLDMASNAMLGKFTPEMIDAARKSLDYDRDVESASAEGEIRGRNAKIEAKLRKQKSGDGLPRFSGGGSSQTGRKAPQSIFDLAREAR